MLVAQWMGGHGFISTILWGIFVKNVIGAAALSAIHCSLVWVVRQTSYQYSHPLQKGDRLK